MSRPGTGAPEPSAGAASAPLQAPAAVGHTPGQTPIKSPDKKKTKVVEQGHPEQVDGTARMDSLPTLILGESDGESLPTPKNLSAAFESAVAQEATPKVQSAILAPRPY